MRPYWNFLRKISIRRQMMIPLIVMVFTATFFTEITDYIRMTHNHEQELETKLSAMTELAALSVSNALWNYNANSMDEIGKAILRDEEIERIAIRSSVGEKLYENIKAGEAYGAVYTSVYESPVIYQNERIGTVSVGVTSYFRRQQMQAAVMQAILHALALIFLSGVVIAAVSRYVTKPIAALEKGTEEIAKGNLDKRIVVETENEVGRLADKFNKMAESLSLRIEERDAASAELVQKNQLLASQNQALNNEIEEKKKAREALVRSEEKFSKAFRYSAEVIALVRLSDRKITEVSDSFYNIFGYGPEEVLEHTTVGLDLWETASMRDELYAQMNERKRVLDFEARWVMKSGGVRIGKLSAEIIEIIAEPFMLLLWSDVTELKNAALALQEANETLEQRIVERTEDYLAANEELQAMNIELSEALNTLKRTQQKLVQSEKLASLGSMISGMAHEINTPVGIVITSISYLEREIKILKEKYSAGTLSRKELTDFFNEEDEILHIVENNLERTDQLIKSFKRISADQITDEKQLFDLKEYLKELVNSLEPLLKKGPYPIKVDCQEDIKIRSYPGAYAQIVTNLINNSIRHGFPPGHPGAMYLDVSLEEGVLKIVFSDNGMGMVPAVRENIFEPFFTTKRGAEGGMGIGLHLVYTTVTQTLNGEIECFSEPGQGTQFVMLIPVEVSRR